MNSPTLISILPGFAGYIKTPTRADAVRTILPEDPHWGTEKQKSGTLHRLTSSLCTADDAASLYQIYEM